MLRWPRTRSTACRKKNGQSDCADWPLKSVPHAAVLLIGVECASIEFGDEVIHEQDVQVASCLVQIPEKTTIGKSRLNCCAVLNPHARNCVGAGVHRQREDVTDAHSRGNEMPELQTLAEHRPPVARHTDKPKAFFDTRLVVLEDAGCEKFEDTLWREQRFFTRKTGDGNRGIRFCDFHNKCDTGSVPAPASCRDVRGCRCPPPAARERKVEAQVRTTLRRVIKWANQRQKH
jgi:hypothetical protein